jgi:hypothetical protein
MKESKNYCLSGSDAVWSARSIPTVAIFRIDKMDEDSRFL